MTFSLDTYGPRGIRFAGENPVAFHANDGKMEKILGSRTERIEGEGSESAHLLLLLLLLDRSIDKIENARGLLPVLMNERLVDAA